MIKQKHLIILIVLLVSGLLIEGMKKFAGLSEQAQHPAQLISFKNYEFMNPFHIIEKLRGRRTNDLSANYNTGAGLKLAQVTPSLPQKYDFSEGHTVAQNAADKKNKNDSEEGKKKKKKKKKSARELAELNKKNKETTDPSEKKDLTKEKSTDADNDADMSRNSQGGTILAQPQEDENKLPVSFEDWAKLILGTPNIQNVTKLISFFQSNMVTSEVFYGLLNAMMEESNPEQHNLAVFAASQVQNANSFKFLVDVLKSETQGTSIGNKINQHLNAYQSLGSVIALNSALINSLNDPVTVQIAITILDRSTKINLEDREPSALSLPETESVVDSASTATVESTTAESTTSDATATGLLDKEQANFEKRQAQARKIFGQFIPTLEHVLATYSTQREIAEPTRLILDRIKNLPVVVSQTND